MYNKIVNYVAEMVEDFEMMEIVEHEEYLAYNLFEDKLYVPKTMEEDKEFDEFMLNYLKEEFGLELKEEQLNIFYILHELGHKETRDSIDYDRYEDEINKIDIKDYLSYRKVFAEYLADHWAVCFIEAFGIEKL